MSRPSAEFEPGPKVLLVGMGITALSALESLVEKLTVAGVVRDCSGNPADPVATLALQLGIPVYSDLRLVSIRKLIADLRPDCTVISSYNRIVDADALQMCPFLNVHYSPLPLYRGRANVNWALINEEPIAAVSIHQVVPGLDAGNILFQKVLRITSRETVSDLYERLNKIQKENLGATVLRFLNSDTGVPQNADDATYGCSRIPEDGEIAWELPTRKIDSLIRALQPPFPGAFTFLRGRRLIVWKAEPVENAPRYVGRIPGRVVEVSKAKGYVDVLTGDGVLRLYEVQEANREKMHAGMIIRSTRDTLGLKTSELLGRIEQLEAELAALTKIFSQQQTTTF